MTTYSLQKKKAYIFLLESQEREITHVLLGTPPDAHNNHTLPLCVQGPGALGHHLLLPQATSRELDRK